MSTLTHSLMKLLPQVFEASAALAHLANINVSGLALDSRRVQAGDLFFARNGAQLRGADFLPDAQAKGACAALVPKGELSDGERRGLTLPIIEVDDLERCIGEVASRFYDEPSQRCKVIGITGTNGKTSCASFVVQALNQLGHKAALIGTLGNGFWGKLDTASHTTPDPISLQALMAELVVAGAEYIVMEVSSHALDQQRVAGVRFEAGAFTNLTRDHLDYHGDMEAYGDAKARLFADYQPAIQLLNLDDVFGRTLWERLEPAPGRVLGFALSDPNADLTLADLTFTPAGQGFRYLGAQGEVQVEAPMMGSFNASNLLLCTGLLEALGFDLPAIGKVLSNLEPVPGRMQPLPADTSKPSVVVDFAHTPDALAQALQALRLHSGSQGELICVFGCGGDRDRGKRAEMAAVAERHADRVVVTSDNPRSEDPRAIVEDVLAGFAKPESVIVCVERDQAIRQAIEMAAAGDLVLLAGKGHEQYQEVAGVRHPFSDFDYAWHVLNEGADV